MHFKSKYKKIAIIDLGTNSVRFDVHLIHPKKSELLYSEKIMVRLGQGVFETQLLQKDAIERTLQAFLHFKTVADELQVEKVIAVGTAALRTAKNNQLLIQKINSKTGIRIQIISGETEAKLIAIGVLSKEKRKKSKTLIIDIGGGSTEVIYVENRTPKKLYSFSFGAARIQEEFLKKTPPNARDLERAQRFISEQVTTVFRKSKWPKCSFAIGSSGSIRALGKMTETKATTKLNSKFSSTRQLEVLSKKMATMSTTQLLQVPKMEAKRVDLIFAGSLILQSIAKTLSVKTFTTTEYSLRYGILYREMKKLQQTRTFDSRSALKEIRKKAFQCEVHPLKLRHSQELAEMLFDSFLSLHQLPLKYRKYLVASALLRDIGQFVSRRAPERHTKYLVKNFDFPFLDAKERELIANLCQYHEKGKRDKMPYKNSPKLQETYLKLLAILRIVEALDFVPTSRINLKQRLKIKSMQLKKSVIKIEVRAPGFPEILTLRLDKKKSLFVSLFNKDLQIIFK